MLSSVDYKPPLNQSRLRNSSNEQRSITHSLLSRDEISLRHFETFLSAGRRLTTAFTDVRTSELTTARIESWLSNLSVENGKPLAVATRNQVHGYVFGILKYGVKIGVLQRNPLDGIDKARSRSRP
jgi:hypothetical protein